MPPALDLTGRRFGKLTVVGRAGKVKFGRLQTAWLCRCDCGKEIIVPQDRLPHTEHIAENTRRKVDACPNCRAHLCSVCRAPILPPSTATTCSEDCRIKQRRKTYLRHYYKKTQSDPEFNRRRHSEIKARAESDPELAEHLRELARQAAARRRDKLAADPERLEEHRARRRARYAVHAEEIQARHRERYASMSPEEQHRWMERMRRYGRAYREKWRAELATDPQRHQAYLDLMKEYRRRKALTHFVAIGAELVERNK